ncbi:MAG: hypothetical protein M3O70_01295 [Actinomycetota bacterium]|nr:hypothetical protein [Actinomycetota bacterium]
MDAAQVEVGLVWNAIGFVTLDGRGKPTFPELPSDPAVYRLALDGPSRPSLYIGETENLRRRSGNYRNPGPSQQTSTRISALLRRHLQVGGTIRLWSPWPSWLATSGWRPPAATPCPRRRTVRPPWTSYTSTTDLGGWW